MTTSARRSFSTEANQSAEVEEETLTVAELMQRLVSELEAARYRLASL